MIKNNQGFTLVELILVIGIIGIIIPVASTLILQAFNIFDQSTEKMNTEQQIEIALSETSDYIKAGKNLPLPDSDNPSKTTLTINSAEDKFEFSSYLDGLEKNIEVKLKNAENKLKLLVNGRLLANNINKLDFEMIDEENKIYKLIINYNDDQEKSKIIFVKN